MKQHLCMMALALIALACFARPAHAGEDHAALVKAVTGVVKVTRQHQTFEATSGTRLEISDHVTTAAGASAAIVFRDGTLLTLGSGADVLLRDYVFKPKQDKFAFSLYLAKGSAIYESGKIGKLSPQSVDVETPSATVGVRGTRFLVEAK